MKEAALVAVVVVLVGTVAGQGSNYDYCSIPHSNLVKEEV